MLGTTERTFEVAGHHYALVRADGPRAGHLARVRGAARRRARLAGGRLGLAAQRLPHLPEGGRRSRSSSAPAASAHPHEPPWTLTKDEDDKGREIDALHALALRMRGQGREDWPDLLRDARRPGLRRRGLARDRHSSSSARRDVSEPPGTQVLDFEEYTRLYREAWSDPSIRWLLSTVSSAMVFDDHDVHDDWNISAAWVEHMRELDWWDDHIAAALLELLGLPAPRQPEPARTRTRTSCSAAVRSAEGDAEHAAARVRAAGRPRRPTAAAGATAATWAARGSW